MLVVLILIPFCSFGRGTQDFQSLSAQASTAREAEHIEDAVKLYREALQLRPGWAEGLWYLGTLSYDRQQFSDAASALGRLVQLAPKDANAFAMLGLSEVKIQRSQPALSHLQQALKLGVGDDANLRQVVLFNEAVLMLNSGKFGEAQSILDQLAQKSQAPEDDLVIALGRSVLGISSASQSPETRDLILAAGKAEVLAANREMEPASAAYAELAKNYSKVHNVQFAYGRFLLNNHLDDQAVSAFKREIENSPQHLLARLGIAGALLETDPAGGVIYAQEAVKLAPKLEEAHYLLGASLLATNRAEQAIVELETAEGLKSDDARVYFALAKAYVRVHRDKEAAWARARFTEVSRNRE